jgi:hypothetical protein
MKKIQIISLRVIALFTVAIFVSFIPEYLHDFFGDWICKGRQYVPSTKEGFLGSYIGCDYQSGGGSHNPQTHWGYRHCLFCMMGIILFSIQSVNIINYIDEND